MTKATDSKIFEDITSDAPIKQLTKQQLLEINKKVQKRFNAVEA